MRVFATGATRDDSDVKPDYEGFLSHMVIRRFGEYMSKHRVQADGGIRASDNWQKGIPKEEYIKSAFRHFVEWWQSHRKGQHRDSVEESLCALLFNVQGYLHEMLKERERLTEEEVQAQAFLASLKPPLNYQRLLQ